MNPTASIGLDPARTARDFAVLLGFGALALAWDMGGADLSVSQGVGSKSGFALRDHFFWQRVMHDAIRWPAWALMAFIAWSSLRAETGKRSRWRWSLLGVVVAMLAIQALKRSSSTSCPWDLQLFGGMATYVSHWALGARDGGPGHCFPAGHASVAFGFLPLWAVWRDQSQVAAWGLALIAVAGIATGITQVVRGAHFVSHILWTAWVCLLVAYALDAARRSLVQRARAALGAPT